MTKDSDITRPLLADKLIDVVDKVRRKIHGALGTRPWAVDIITRRWSGADRGIGSYSDTILTLDPTPMVEKMTKNRLGPGGQESTGSIVVTGVSLRYTEAELRPTVDQRTEVAYRLRDLHGQRQKDRFFVLASDPLPRRGDKPGDGTDWKLILNETSPLSNVGQVNEP